jgi:hypothetical protein
MLIEYTFDLVVELCFWVTMLILQLELDVAPELIVLREHRYHRDLKNFLVLIPAHKIGVRNTIVIRTNITKILQV